MVNHDRWLKNVSQADVARVAREKREREKAYELPETKQPVKAPIPSPTIPNHPQPHPITSNVIAPVRDFNRRANSLDRQALPAGSFPGSSKKIYDAIYVRTRGAIQPHLEIQAKKRSLMDWSGIKNIKTIETHLRHLVAVGLMTKRGENGDPAGYWYGVRLPEEISKGFEAYPPQPSPTIPNHDGEAPWGTITNQKTEMVGDPKRVVVGEGKTVDFKRDNVLPNTSSNTTTIDDDALAPLIKVFKDLSLELTGKTLKASDADRWKELADLLKSEIQRAASHTNVSNLPAFLTEHLRRRLSREEKPAKMVKKDEVGKVAKTTAQPMTNEERSEVVQMIVEMISGGGYTFEQAEAQFGTGLRPEDWAAIRAQVEEKESHS